MKLHNSSKHLGDRQLKSPIHQYEMSGVAGAMEGKQIPFMQVSSKITVVRVKR